MNLGLVIVLLLMLHVVMKFNLGQDSEARFGQDFEDQVLWRGWCLVEILKMMLGRDSEDEIWSRFVFELVIRTQPSGPLCLWQCFSSGEHSLSVIFSRAGRADPAFYICDHLFFIFAITWWFVFTFPSFGIDFFGDFCSTGPKLFWLLIREHFNSKIIAL